MRAHRQRERGETRTYTNASAPDRAHGVLTELRTDASPAIVTYIRFEVQGAGQTPSAVLRVFAETANSSGFEVHAVADNTWDQALLTAASAPPVGALLGRSGPVTARAYYDVDVSSAVQGNGPVSFALTSSSATATRYGSREGTHPPLLVVPAPPAPASFAVTRDGATYRAVDAAAGLSHTGSLKSVVESAVADMTGRAGTVTFAAGEFDLGADSLRFIDVADVTFAGQGIDATVIRNSSDENRDTEPFLFRGAEGVVIRDLTVSAGGSPRATSDAIDLGAVMGGLIDRVKIASSRSRGIVTDGKDAIGSAEATSSGTASSRAYPATASSCSPRARAPSRAARSGTSAARASSSARRRRSPRSRTSPPTTTS